MMLTVNNVEVTKRRNSRNKKCNKNWNEYDFEVARHYLEKMGCRPVYGIWGSSYPTCNSTEKMAMALSYGIQPPITEPCQSADKIVFEHMDKYNTGDNVYDGRNGAFSIYVDMLVSRVKVIEQQRAYNLQSLIGNSGGYIGLLLGT